MSKSEVIGIKLNWDVKNTHLFAAKLLRHVNKGQFEFTLEAKKGSLFTDIIIVIAETSIGGAIGTVSGMYVVRMIDSYLEKRRREENEIGNKLGKGELYYERVMENYEPKSFILTKSRNLEEFRHRR